MSEMQIKIAKCDGVIKFTFVWQLIFINIYFPF